MPQTDQNYTVEFKQAHLNWGIHRHTNTRDLIPGEGYIQIPAPEAYEFDIRRGSTYNCTSSDGLFNCILRAAGNQSRPTYAKQFESDGSLQILGNWLRDICHAEVGDSIQVYWTSPHDIVLTFISQHAV